MASTYIVLGLTFFHVLLSASQGGSKPSSAQKCSKSILEHRVEQPFKINDKFWRHMLGDFSVRGVHNQGAVVDRVLAGGGHLFESMKTFIEEQSALEAFYVRDIESVRNINPYWYTTSGAHSGVQFIKLPESSLSKKARQNMLMPHFYRSAGYLWKSIFPFESTKEVIEEWINQVLENPSELKLNENGRGVIRGLVKNPYGNKKPFLLQLNISDNKVVSAFPAWKQPESRRDIYRFEDAVKIQISSDITYLYREIELKYGSGIPSPDKALVYYQKILPDSVRSLIGIEELVLKPKMIKKYLPKIERLSENDIRQVVAFLENDIVRSLPYYLVKSFGLNVNSTALSKFKYLDVYLTIKTAVSILRVYDSLKASSYFNEILPVLMQSRASVDSVVDYIETRSFFMHLYELSANLSFRHLEALTTNKEVDKQSLSQFLELLIVSPSYFTVHKDLGSLVHLDFARFPFLSPQNFVDTNYPALTGYPSLQHEYIKKAGGKESAYKMTPQIKNALQEPWSTYIKKHWSKRSLFSLSESKNELIELVLEISSLSSYKNLLKFLEDQLHFIRDDFEEIHRGFQSYSQNREAVSFATIGKAFPGTFPEAKENRVGFGDFEVMLYLKVSQYHNIHQALIKHKQNYPQLYLDGREDLLARFQAKDAKVQFSLNATQKLWGELLQMYKKHRE